MTATTLAVLSHFISLAEIAHLAFSIHALSAVFSLTPATSLVGAHVFSDEPFPTAWQLIPTPQPASTRVSTLTQRWIACG